MQDLKHQKILNERHMSPADIIICNIAPELWKCHIQCLPEVTVKLLQKVQNMAARIIPETVQQNA